MVELAIPLSNVTRWKAPTGRRGYIRLDLNEGGAPPEELLAELRSFDPFVIAAYPEYDYLLELLSQYAGIESKSIVLANGADQAIDLCLRLFFKPGSKVLVPSPVFSIYDHILRIIGARQIVESYCDRDNQFHLSLDSIVSALPNVDGLILCNPNNPLGSFLREDELLPVLEATARRDIPTILDEAYFEYGGGTLAHLLPRYPNLIIIRTFSKYFALAGLRLGYILSDDAIADNLLKIRGPWDINQFAVHAASACLRNLAFFREMHERGLATKRSLELCLQESGLVVYQTATNFSLAKHASQALVDGLRKQGILVNSLSGYPNSRGLLEDAIRIAIPLGADHPYVELMFRTQQFTRRLA